jgi:exopolysaccharide biosynthesis protein
MKKTMLFLILGLTFLQVKAQWKDVSESFGLKTESIKLFEWQGNYNDSAFRAYYVKINTKDKQVTINTDTTLYRRLTPMQFYNRLQSPTVVVNASFFEFKNNTNLNVIVKDGKVVAYNLNSMLNKGKDTFTYTHVLASAIGMKKNGFLKNNNELDVAYTFTDSSMKNVYYQSTPLAPFKDSIAKLNLNHPRLQNLAPWKVSWAVGGGPVLIRDNQISISNEQERKFTGKAILDRHPRTAMGYTKDGDLIILAIQGRMKGIAVGATLGETASLLLNLGCIEGLNLDGGGSSCLLVNGKETIKPSDPTGERPVPAILYVNQ